MKEKIAIIGSGIAGLSTAYFSQDKYDVTLFEKNNYLGGHANTRSVDTIEKVIPVDTGFIVYNELTYPNLTKLFKEIEVNTDDSDMSFSFYNPSKSFEYGGGSLSSLISDKRNLFRPYFYIMIKDIIRFYKKFQTNVPNSTITVEDYCINNNYSKSFIEFHLLPLISSIWSTPNNLSIKQPLKNIVSFFQNHKLFNFLDRPKWKTVRGGSKQYIKKIVSKTKMKINMEVNINKINFNNNKIEISYDGTQNIFDKVVYAAPPNRFLKVNNYWSEKEKKIFNKFKFQTNIAQLHENITTMPKLKKTWSSWNFFNDQGDCSLTYWMNLLQTLETKKNIFVSLNQNFQNNIFYETEYDHPIFNNESVLSQKSIGEIQGHKNSYYTGSYLGYGFHEDGIQSAVYISKMLGVDIPWKRDNKFYNRLLY